MGICLGNQIIALAIGGDTYKMKYGHRSQNQPVMNQFDKRCYITTQNHGYVVDYETIPKDWQTYYTNLNDDSCEGIIHKSGKFFSVQFHPEAYPGPTTLELTTRSARPFREMTLTISGAGVASGGTQTGPATM